MALNDGAFKAVLQGIFNEMWSGAGGRVKDSAWYAEKLAKAIDDQIKTAEVLPGISVTGGSVSGGAVTGLTTANGKIQ
jgi:hypothetical protein